LPSLAELFHLAPISLLDFGLIFVVVLIGLSWFEILKLFNRRLKLD